MMNTTHILTLEAVSTFLCQREDGSFYTPSESVTKGTQVELVVSTVITASTIFAQPATSTHLDDIISQFHEKGIKISKKQLACAYWKVI